MLVQLTLTKVSYRGDSIGDDIRIEIDCLNHSLDFNKTIRNGSEVSVNKMVGEFFTNQASVTLPLFVRVIERDLIFNDFGTAAETFSVDTGDSKPRRFTVSVAVQETRNYRSKNKAAFILTFEARAIDAIQYVKYDASGDGWVVVVPENKRIEKKISIPYYLKLQLESQSLKRQYFRIMEGPRRNERASVEIVASSEIPLQPENPHTGPVYCVYILSEKKLKVGNKTYMLRDYPDDPVPKGIHDIEIADAPHRAGELYVDRARLAKVWFRVGHAGERYVHVGSISRGCVTLTEIERWDELCAVLLKARKGDGLSVGTLQVVS